MHILLRREGLTINRKKTQRLYREEGLTVRRRKGRKRAVGARVPAPVSALPNQRWSLDFVHDQMITGRRFRVLNVVDDVTRECLAAVPDTSISGKRVVRELAEQISTDAHELQAAATRAGERATWPKIAMIRDQTIIGQTLEDCIIRLKKQHLNRASDENKLRLA